MEVSYQREEKQVSGLQLAGVITIGVSLNLVCRANVVSIFEMEQFAVAKLHQLRNRLRLFPWPVDGVNHCIAQNDNFVSVCEILIRISDFIFRDDHRSEEDLNCVLETIHAAIDSSERNFREITVDVKDDALVDEVFYPFKHLCLKMMNRIVERSGQRLWRANQVFGEHR